MKKMRLDQALVNQGLVESRSQAESYVKLGRVLVNGQTVAKPGYFVNSADKVELNQQEQYVSRAGLKLAGAVEKLGLDFTGKVVLDTGSSTGGFTDYALRHGARKVIAVDVGTDQLHHRLHNHPRIELHEKTDIRNLDATVKPDVILADLSFISVREVLPKLAKLSKSSTQTLVLVKPQFEAGKEQINRGIVKNDAIRRRILSDFEKWTKDYFVVIGKADSEIAGAKGNRERFYLLKTLA